MRNQDLVNWVTVGAFDVPTSESAPITSVAGRRLAFWLLPYNYFDEVQPEPAAGHNNDVEFVDDTVLINERFIMINA